MNLIMTLTGAIALFLGAVIILIGIVNNDDHTKVSGLVISVGGLAICKAERHD